MAETPRCAWMRGMTRHVLVLHSMPQDAFSFGEQPQEDIRFRGNSTFSTYIRAIFQRVTVWTLKLDAFSSQEAMCKNGEAVAVSILHLHQFWPCILCAFEEDEVATCVLESVLCVAQTYLNWMIPSTPPAEEPQTIRNLRYVLLRARRISMFEFLTGSYLSVPIATLYSRHHCNLHSLKQVSYSHVVDLQQQQQQQGQRNDGDAKFNENLIGFVLEVSTVPGSSSQQETPQLDATFTILIHNLFDPI